MALQNDRPLWFSQIRTEFGLGNTFSSYLGAAPGVPSSRPLYMSNFLGKSNAPDYTPDAISWDDVTGVFYSGSNVYASSGWKLVNGTNVTIQLLFRVKDWAAVGSGTKTFAVATTNNTGGTAYNSRTGNGDIYLDVVPGAQFRYELSITGYSGSLPSSGSCNFECWNMTAPWPHQNLTSSTNCFVSRDTFT